MVNNSLIIHAIKIHPFQYLQLSNNSSNDIPCDFALDSHNVRC